MCCSAQYCRDQLLYSREIHVGMYCTYLNQEYSVRGKTSTFKYFCLFADFCDLFSLPQPDENCGNSCLTIFS